MQKLSFPSYKMTKFVLLGSGSTLCRFYTLLIKNNFPKPIIVTHPKKFHKRDQYLYKNSKNFVDLFEFSKINKIEIFESEKLNDQNFINSLLKLGCNAAFSISCRTIIKKPLLNSFKNRVFNIHPSLLPEEKGAGILSWRIMNNKKYVAATLHQIDEGIDSGPIIFQKKKFIATKHISPEYYSIKTDELYDELLLQFLKKIKNDKFVFLKKQNDMNSTYFHRLYTEINAAINWDWSNKEIELFINAFGIPYPGAFTFVNDEKISIIKANSEISSKYFHPYIYGKVIKIFVDGSVRVVTKNGFLRIHEISINGKTVSASNKIKLADTLYTPSEILLKGRIQITNVKDMKNPEKHNN